MMRNRIARYFDSDEHFVLPPDGPFDARFMARYERHWWHRSQPNDAYMKILHFDDGRTAIVAVGSVEQVDEFMRIMRAWLGKIVDEFWTADRTGAAMIGQGGAL